MYELFALVTFWGLYGLALWVLSRRGRLNIWKRAALAVGCLAVSGGLYWVLFDIPGLLRMQRLMYAGDYDAAAAAHRPLFQPDGRITMAIFSLALLSLGLHMVIRPDYYLRAATATRTPPSQQVPGRSAVIRFRIYGVVVTLGGVVAAAAALWGMASA